jgi:hypothetical protein
MGDFFKGWRKSLNGENEIANQITGKTQERIVNENLRVWAGTKSGKIYRLSLGMAFVFAMVCVWICSPNGNPLLGPLQLLGYNGVTVESLVFCAVSLAVFFAFLIKPHIITAVISILGGMNWLFWGLVVPGIGC